jgi:hypothetical protein
MRNQINISVLVPSYEYFEGVNRILKHYELSEDKEGVNIIISDDSKSNEIRNLVYKNNFFKLGKIQYKKNNPSLGAVKNWNSLIEYSKSEYLFILHQDECPVSLNFYSELKKIIIDNNKPDLIFLRCAHIVCRGMYSPYMTSKFLKLVLNLIPQFILLRNVVGSPSNIIFKKVTAQKFDDNLQWLVDVDWFFLFLKKNLSWISAPKLKILSVVDDQTSITKSISSNIKSILFKESEYLKNKHENLFIFRIINPKNTYDFILSQLESVIWNFTKIFNFIFSIFNIKKLPKWW